MFKIHDNKGFSLIEILVSMFVVTLTVLGVLSYILLVEKGNKYGKRSTTAMNIAQEKLEDFIRMDYNDASFVTTPGIETAGVDNDYEIDYEWYVSVQPDDPVTDMKRVTVEVYWNVKWPDAQHQNWPGTNTTSNKVQLNVVIAK